MGDAVMVQHPGLTSVARNKLPPGKFPKPWTEGALEPPPPLPADATWKDLLTHRSFVEKKEEWWKDNNHLLFSIITESMEKTAPTLREILRERFHVADTRDAYTSSSSQPRITAPTCSPKRSTINLRSPPRRRDEPGSSLSKRSLIAAG